MQPEQQTQQPEPDYEKQADDLLRLNGLSADSQPTQIDRGKRRLIYVAVFFVIFCLVITAMTYAFKPGK